MGILVRMVLVAAALGLAASMQGCASLSEAECLSADWTVMGEADGRLGRPLSDLNRYRRDCAQYGVVPDSQAYIKGRERGLAVYCTQDNGYREGRGGAAGELVCPAALEPGFRRGYDLGRAVYDSLTQLRHANEGIASARAEIDRLESDLADRKKSIGSDDLSDEKKRKLREEARSMENRIDNLKDEIALLIGTIAFSIAQYQSAVEAARGGGYNEPMDVALLQTLHQIIR